MCGLAGIVKLNDQEMVSPRQLIKMSEVISHRGPDDEGYIFIDRMQGESRHFSGVGSCSETKIGYPPIQMLNEGFRSQIAFCHRRFSIIDPNARSHQPMMLSDHSLCIVFNGEIYNYIELMAELKAAGAIFGTQSDTEVILWAYRIWGSQCFKRFNGFWSLVIYDFNTKQVIASRDRFGKKPLYYFKGRDSIYFASEIKALLQVEEVGQSLALEESVAFHWLYTNRKNLDNRSFFKGIHSFPASCWAIINEDFPGNFIKYWDVPSERINEKAVSVSEAVLNIRSILNDAVKIRLRADVPTCVELSGGLDSSSLVASVAGMASSRVSTYTVEFSEDQWNEAPFAKMVADRFETDHRVLKNPIGHFWQNILPFTFLHEEPYHSPNLQANQEIWQSMRQDGIKVSLNGGAGDEVFAGYGSYFGPALMEGLLKGNYSSVWKNFANYSESPSIAITLKRVFKSMAVHFIDSRFSCSWRKKIRPKIFPFYFERNFLMEKGDYRLSSFLSQDLTRTLMPYWLASGDKNGMGVPLEVRAPFLDYRLVEYVSRLPISYLIRDGWHKWILRKAFENDLPESVVWRKNKMGFPFPYDKFYRENSKIIDLILSESRNPVVQPSKEREVYYSWNVISFLLWYELFFNKNLDLFYEIKTLAGSADTHKRAYGAAYLSTPVRV